MSGLIAYESADASCSSRKQNTISNKLRTREVELENRRLASMLEKQLARGDTSSRNRGSISGKSTQKNALVQSEIPKHAHLLFRKNSKIMS